MCSAHLEQDKDQYIYICSVLRFACFGCKKKSLLTAIITNVERERTDKRQPKPTNQTQGLEIIARLGGGTREGCFDVA